MDKIAIGLGVILSVCSLILSINAVSENCTGRNFISVVILTWMICTFISSGIIYGIYMILIGIYKCL